MKRQPKVATQQKKPRKLALNQFPFTLEKDDSSIYLSLPIKTVSEANNFDHHMIKYQRHKSQKKMVRIILNQINKEIPLPCTIKLTRYASRSLDKHDNLPISFKYIVDELCAFITGKDRGRGDDDERISIYYDQVKSKYYGVKIEIKF